MGVKGDRGAYQVFISCEVLVYSVTGSVHLTGLRIAWVWRHPADLFKMKCLVVGCILSPYRFITRLVIIKM